MKRTQFFSVVLVSLLLSPVACGSSEDPSSSSPTRANPSGDFWELIAELKHDYTYFNTLKELWGITDVTIIGRIEKVKEGRGIGGKKGERGTIETALLTVELIEVVRGEIDEKSRRKVDVEIQRPESATIEELAEKKPGQEILFLLQDVAGQPQPSEVDNEGVERDPDKVLYTIPTPKALFIERDGDVMTPLDPVEGPYEESIQATTIDELADEIRQF